MPLVPAYIKAYLKKKLGDKVECELFRYPDILIAVIKKDVPDVLMISNYIWNEALSLYIISLIKKHNPDVLTIMGGPNISLDKDKQEEYMRENYNLDFYILGEGEIPSFQLIKLFIEGNQSIEKLKLYDIDSCTYIKSDGSFYLGKRMPGLKNLDDIPSPWLLGYLDKFFDGKLAPYMETVRGCPFSCGYCVQGTKFYCGIRRPPLERIKKEIIFVVEKMKENSPEVGYFGLTDSNFGMYKEDVIVSKLISDLNKKYGYPTYIDATTGINARGGNARKYTFQTAFNLKDSLAMYTSVQSMNPNVLKNIRRKNISIDEMKEVQMEAKSKGIRTMTDTILSLPGETFESHRDCLFQLIDMGITQFTNYQCMLLKGSYLETTECKEKFKVNTQYRVLPNNFGVYDRKKVFEIEEIITSTSTLTFSDYLKARKIHLVIMIYYNGLRFEPLIKFIESHGIKCSFWLNELFKNINNASKNIINLFSDFLNETKGELFDSYGECVAFYSEEENFQRLLNGEVGGNLLFKYLSITVFKIWNDIVEYAFNVAKKFIKEKDFDFLDNLKRFMCCNVASGESSSQILSNVECKFNYDIKSWIDNGYNISFDEYRFKHPTLVQFFLPDESHRIIKNALILYGEDDVGRMNLLRRIQYADMSRKSKILNVV